MHTRFPLLLCLSIFLTTAVLAEQRYKNWPDLSGPILGQQLPGMTAKIFAPGIISTEHSESNSVLSPKGDEFYFTTWTKETGTKIMFSRLEEGKWTAPKLASFSKGFGDVDVAINYDGNKLFFGSNRPWPGETEDREKGFDIWFAKRIGIKLAGMKNNFLDL